VLKTFYMFRAELPIFRKYILNQMHLSAKCHIWYMLINSRPVYSTCRPCQQTQTLNLLVVVQGQCTMGCAADESGMEGGFSAP
jgi:hypothetical protein